VTGVISKSVCDSICPDYFNNVKDSIFKSEIYSCFQIEKFNILHAICFKFIYFSKTFKKIYVFYFFA